MEKGKAKLELILRYFPGLSARKLEQLESLDGLYREWNNQINVISRKDLDGLYEKHVLHSLGIAAAFDFQKGARVLDIGTGGGFPGIPLAIFFPESQFHLVDSIGKKIKVVRAVSDQIGLTNLSAEHTRAEHIPGGSFDVVVSRAVASLRELWTWAKPLLRKDPGPPAPADAGSKENSRLPACGLICLKGGDLGAEISASGCRPRILSLSDFFAEPYFREKYILQIYS